MAGVEGVKNLSALFFLGGELESADDLSVTKEGRLRVLTVGQFDLTLEEWVSCRTDGYCKLVTDYIG